MYGTPPFDPNEVTQETLALHVEATLALFHKATLNRCEECGTETYFRRCPVCPGRPALSRIERLAEDAEAGVQVDWEAEFAETFNQGLVGPDQRVKQGD